MRFHAAPLAAAAAAIWVAAGGCTRSPLHDGRDAAPDLAVEAPTRGDSRTEPPDATLDVAADVIDDLAATDTAPPDSSDDATDASADVPAGADASPADRATDLPGDASDLRPQDQPCGALGIICAPFACDVARGVCRTACASDDECGAGIVCRNGTCGGITRTSCAANNECNSGFCAQGVCCNTACLGICASCALPGSIGVCSPVPSGGPDPFNRCPGTTCDGAGSCAMPSCTADEQCAVRHWCTEGRCLPCVATCTSNAACVSGICIKRNECSYCATAFDAGP